MNACKSTKTIICNMRGAPSCPNNCSTDIRIFNLILFRRGLGGGGAIGVALQPRKCITDTKKKCSHWNIFVIQWIWKSTERSPKRCPKSGCRWTFIEYSLDLKRESPSCARLRKGANYVCVFAWLCIVFKLTSNWYLNSGDLTILVTSFLLWKTKILYLLSGLFRLSNLKLHMNDSKTV